MATTVAMVELWQGAPAVAQSEMRLTKGVTVGAARWERQSRVRRSFGLEGGGGSAVELTRGDGGGGAVLGGAVLFRGEKKGEHGMRESGRE